VAVSSSLGNADLKAALSVGGDRPISTLLISYGALNLRIEGLDWDAPGSAKKKQINRS